jgi:hypothetical protein
LEEKDKWGINLFRLNNERYLDSYRINNEDPSYNDYRQFLFLAKQLITLYQRSQRNSLLSEPPFRFGSIAEIKHMQNAKRIAEKIIKTYPEERKRLIEEGRINYSGLMLASMMYKKNLGCEKNAD